MIDQLIKHLPTIDPADLHEFFEERAAVREFEAGFPRDEAERLAFLDTIDHFGIVNHINQTTNI